MLDDKDMMNPKEEQPAEGATPEQRLAESPVHNPALELPEIPAPALAEPVLAVEPPERPEPKRSAAGWKLVAAAIALVAVGAGVGSATTWALANRFPVGTPIGVLPVQQSPGAKLVSQTPFEGGANVIPSIYNKVSPAMVAITVSSGNNRFMRASGSGSGFVVDPRGYILTNHHVIDGASKITVKFVDGTTLDAKVVGADRFQDLAVIKVDPGNRSLVAVELGDSDQVQVGELAIAIGSPFGQNYSVTAGIVSGLNRELQEEGNPYVIQGAIQTDASINPGNSGGPLLNDRGQVIGINTAIEGPVRGSVGIGFAVPINTAKQILPTLIAGQNVEYAYLGVGMNDLTPDIAQAIGVTATEGAVISEVQPDTPAAQAGLQSAGFTRRGELISADVIIQIDDTPIKSSSDVANYIRTKKVGDTITMTVLRGKEKLTLTTKLAARPQETEE